MSHRHQQLWQGLHYFTVQPLCQMKFWTDHQYTSLDPCFSYHQGEESESWSTKLLPSTPSFMEFSCLKTNMANECQIKKKKLEFFSLSSVVKLRSPQVKWETWKSLVNLVSLFLSQLMLFTWIPWMLLLTKEEQMETSLLPLPCLWISETFKCHGGKRITLASIQ